MPRMYVDLDTLLTHPVLARGGWSFNGKSVLVPGVLDSVIQRASARCDAYLRRQAQLPGTTTLAAPVAQGANKLTVTSILNLDQAPRLLLQVGTGGTQEWVQAGSWRSEPPNLSPYKGTLTLFPNVTFAYAHSPGEPVVGWWYEQTRVMGGETSTSDQWWDLSQQGQIAAAHAPHMGMGGSVRIVFLQNMPILAIHNISIIYPWGNSPDPGTPNDLFINYDEGWVRFPIGTWNPETSLVWTAYRAGYDQVPEDYAQACMYDALAELALANNPGGANSQSNAGRTESYGGANGVNLYSIEAQNLLRPHRALT